MHIKNIHGPTSKGSAAQIKLYKKNMSFKIKKFSYYKLHHTYPTTPINNLGNSKLRSNNRFYLIKLSVNYHFLTNDERIRLRKKKKKRIQHVTSYGLRFIKMYYKCHAPPRSIWNLLARAHLYVYQRDLLYTQSKHENSIREN